MKRAILFVAFAAICGAQTTVNGGRDYKGTLKASGSVSAVDFSGAGGTAPAKAGDSASRPSACTQGQIYFATDAAAGQNLYFCTATGAPGVWTQMSGAATGTATVGTGAPSGNCIPPAMYVDTTNQDLSACVAPNTWKKVLSTSNTGTYTATGAAGAAPPNPASGEVTCYYSSVSLTQICLDASGNAFTMVKADAGASNSFLTAISAAGVISKAQPSVASLSDTKTGSGSLVLATSPTLTTPTIGVATATSINKVAVTAPATSATLTIPDGVTLTGPPSSATVATLGLTNTFTGRQNATGAASTAPVKAGTSIPGTCTVGDVFFKSDATAGQNLYFCTATDTYTQQLNSGSGYTGCTASGSNGITCTGAMTASQFIGDVTKSGGGYFQGVTSGGAAIAARDVAGTAITYYLPTTNGTAGQVLSDSGAVTCDANLPTGFPATCHLMVWVTPMSTTAGGDLTGTLPSPTVAKVNGTSVPTNSAADQVLLTTASATGAWVSVANCVAAGGVLQYATATHAYACHTLASADIPNNAANTSGTAAGLAGAYIDWSAGSGGASILNKPSTFAPTAHNLLSASHGDSTAAAAVRGDGLFAIGATPTWQRLAHSAATGGYWKWNGTDVVVSTGAAAGTGACTNGVMTGANADAAPSCTTADTTTTHAMFATAGAPAFRALAAGDLPGTLTSATAITSAALTTPVVTTDIHAASAGGATVGTAALPFSSVYLGGAATNNIRLTGTSAAARVITVPDVAADSTAVLAATSTTTTQALFASSTAGLGTYRAIAAGDLPSTLTSGTAITNASLTTPALGTPASGVITNLTGTATNITYDAEGTGNTLTIPFTIWLPGAGCNNATAASFWDLPTVTPAVATCVTGTNTQKGVLAYADTTGGFSAQNQYLLPSDWTGTVDAKILWSTSATGGNAKWSLSTICTATNATETDDAAFNPASTVTTAAPGAANRLQTSAITTVTVTGCAAGEFLHLKLFRDGNDAADTISSTAYVIGVELKVRRAM